MKIKLLSILFSTSLFIGCDKTEEPQPEAKAPSEEAPTPEDDVKLPPPPSLAPEQPTTELGTYPVPGDLEAEADRTIAIENLEAELDRLEAEIGG